MENPFEVCHEAEAPTSAADQAAYASEQPAWVSAHEGVARPDMPAADSGSLSLLVGVFVLIGLDITHVRRVFKTLPSDLLTIRQRENAFDEHTANEKRVVLLMMIELCVVEGLLFFLWLGGNTATVAADQARPMASTILALTGLAGGFLIFQFAACMTVGYAFTDRLRASLWRKGLNASAMLLGVCLAAPALLALFYPALTSKMLIVAAILYILSRICFISKGFRIFYTNFPSLLYFILYLCTLEIIPVIAVTSLAAEICVKVQ